ncbi:MAG: hypothetical protein ACPGUH_03110 [Winogradskyella sp.]
MKKIYNLLFLLLKDFKSYKQCVLDAKIYTETPRLPHTNSTKVVTFKLNFNKPILIDEDRIETDNNQKFYIQSIFNTDNKPQKKGTILKAGLYKVVAKSKNSIKISENLKLKIVVNNELHIINPIIVDDLLMT